MTNNFRKLYLLVWKNFILQIRRPIGTAIEIILPIAFLALLILARVRIKRKEKCLEVFNKTDIADQSKYLFDYANKLQQEKKLNVSKVSHFRLGYYPNDEKTTILLQSAISDFDAPLILAQRTIVGNKIFGSMNEIISDAKEHRDKYLGVVVFENVENGTNDWPKNIEYSIRLHHSTGKLYSNGRGVRGWLTKRVYNDYVRPGASKFKLYESPFLSLQYYVDSAIIRHQSNKSQGFSTAAQYVQQYPYPDYTSDPFVNMVGFLIPLMIILAFIYTAAMIVKEIVSEKQFRLTESMKMMGLPGWIHWTAWFIKVFIFFLIVIIILTILLKGGKIFEFSNGVVIFITLLLWVVASIFFLFLISSFCSIGTRGMLASSTLWFVSFAPFLAVQNPTQYDNLSMQAKRACCLLPNTCLGIMVKTISRYEGEQIGVNWGNINEPVTVDENFSLTTAFGMLVLDSALFAFLTWYITNVFPGEYGIPKPFYFPFLPSYWCPSKSVSADDLDVELLGNENFEQEPNLEVGIQIKHLKKVFQGATGKKVAVENLSLNIYKGQITALLGHNGAGKTTTLSILTGLFPPSKGNATVGGKSILTDMDAIRDSLGLCPQHNVLFDRLTVKEHLQFFSALKGVPKDKAELEVMNLIRDIQLLEKSDERSATLSGGMKRKLNCAIALVGGSETVILDEPTSGMDPYARRATWDLLQRYRGNKTIIITTHHMDEADYLGDRIAIMSEGNVRCCGSSLFLKKRFGVGYHLTLVKSPDFHENRTVSLINDTIPSAKMVGNIAAEMSYILQEDSSKSFQGLFQVLEDDKDHYGITSFGVSVTTLEEVFLKVGEGDGMALIKDPAEDSGGDQEVLTAMKDVKDYKLKSGFSLRASQFKAMFLKRFLNSKRQKKALFTQIILPIGLVLLGFLLSTGIVTQEDEPSRKLTLDMLKEKDEALIAFLSDTSQTFKRSLKDMASSYFQSVDVQLEDVSDKVSNITSGNQGSDVQVLFSKNPFSGKIIGNNQTACCRYQYLILNKQCQNTSTCEDNDGCGLNPILANTSYLQEYVLEDSAKNIKKYFRKKVAGLSIDNDLYTPIVWYSNQAFHTLPSAYSAVSNIILKHETRDGSYGIVTYNHPLPRSTQERSDLSLENWSNLTLIIFVLFGCCSLAASFITFIIDEKTSKAKHVQFVSGVNALCYWGATYCWDVLNFLFPGIGIFLLFVIFNVDDYDGELGSILAVTLLFGISLLPFVYILSFFFTSSMAGYGFVGMLVQLLSLAMYLAVVICIQIKEDDAVHIMHHVFLLFPTYSYPTALKDIALNNVQRRNCQRDIFSQGYCIQQANKTGKPLYQEDTFSLDSPAIGYHCLYMIITAVVYFVIILLMEVNFFIGHLLSYGRNKVFASNAPEDADVAAERQMIHAMPPGELSKSALVVKDLTKVYQTTGMVAVDHLNVGIPKGECFGLLGINGAGKTTTFGMLTGDLSISEGKAYLHGYDLQTQLKFVQQLIGYCPQFDALVDTMTGREMLRMFAQLRGISGDMTNEVVDNAIEQLNLKGWADKMCGTYSGGNKRKLSTAIALVGNPAVVFLDEPTSGMDPASRRHLWNTLTDVLTSGKSIVLTSHSMEECEALCTRLVIMVNGKFKCIGSIQHLKSRFGQGYTVMLKINSNLNINGVTNSAYVGNDEGTYISPIHNVKAFMNTHFPGALLQEEHQGLLQYQIVDRSIKLSQIFGTLEENVDNLGLADYSVSQTSLEQVFVNFAKEQYSEDRMKQKTCCSCSCF